MDRRSFIYTGGLAAAGIALTGCGDGDGLRPAPPGPTLAASQNFQDRNFGPPPISDRLNQGPFPQYGSGAVVPDSDVVMATVSHREPNPGFGKGLITYIVADQGLDEIHATDKMAEIDRLVAFPLGDKVYLRPTWREIQPVPGRLRFPEYWHRTFDAAKTYGKRVSFRIQLRAPDYHAEALPDFVLQRIPMVKLTGYTGDDRWGATSYYEPRYDDPFFQDAWRDMVDQLAAIYDGHPLVETVDAFMYGFWGEGHTWPFENNPFPSFEIARKTWVDMFDHQRDLWKKTPLVVNTQPDFSQVGNDALVDRAVRSFNWLRTDTVFIENTQIDEISNRPPWTGATLEVGVKPDLPPPLTNPDDISRVENTMRHVLDVGPNYWSLWNFHGISVDNLTRYTERFPDVLDDVKTRIGYRVRPTLIWAYQKDDRPGLVVGLINDGVAAVPGALRISVEDAAGKQLDGGSLDPGYPLPGKIRQAQLLLPPGTDWRGLRLRAELEVKGVRYPVTWACTPKPNPDGTLTLRPNLES